MRNGNVKFGKFLGFIVWMVGLQTGQLYSQKFEPKFESIEIIGLAHGNGSTSIGGSFTIGDYIPSADQGDYRIEFTEQSFVCLNRETDMEIWSVKREIEKDTEYHFLNCSADEVLFAAFPSSTKERKFANPPAVHRVQLTDGVWREPLELPETDLEEKQAEFLAEAMVVEGRTIAFSKIILNDPSSHKHGNQLGFRIACFDSLHQLAWVKRFETQGDRDRLGVFILGGGGPAQADGRPSHLNVHKNLLVVCGGPVDDIVALDMETGESLWTMPRIWEIRRGFTGPSVWAHHLGRYGFQDWDLERIDIELPPDATEAEKEYKDARRREVARAKERVGSETNSIVAGPFLVPTGGKTHGQKPELRIFVATANCHGEIDWSSYVSDCLVYELDQDGKPLSMVQMPRMVLDTGSYVLSDGIILRCQNGALAKMGLTKQSFGIGPFDAPDRLGLLEWYREIRTEENDAWLSTPPANAKIHYHGNYAFYVKTGGFIEHDERQVYCFPVETMNLATGVERQLTVRVPFDGTLKLPTENYSSDGKSTRSMHPFEMAVTGIQGDSERLTIVLATKNEKKSLKIPYSALIPLEP
ncbi:MAG: hypothetical protein Q8M16_10580 [Pirellulaceae bacterium]|nr:hypothetical protein [Pirellulaceae bacterium]